MPDVLPTDVNDEEFKKWVAEKWGYKKLPMAGSTPAGTAKFFRTGDWAAKRPQNDRPAKFHSRVITRSYGNEDPSRFLPGHTRILPGDTPWRKFGESSRLITALPKRFAGHSNPTIRAATM